MFNTKNTETRPGSVAPIASSSSSSSPAVNIIGTGTSIEGEVSSDGDIRIDGRVKGTITSKSKVVVGTTGSVDGDIICENADISGKVFGTVEVDDLLFLKASAYVEGDITTTKFVVESGAKFNGSCRMGVKEIKPSEKITNSPSPNSKRKPANPGDYARFAGIGFQLIVVVMLAFLLGYWLDNLLKLSFPIFKVSLSFAGVLLALYLVVKEISKPK